MKNKRLRDDLVFIYLCIHITVNDSRRMDREHENQSEIGSEVMGVSLKDNHRIYFLILEELNLIGHFIIQFFF